MNKIKLYCFPHSGGSVMTFQPWKGLIDHHHVDFRPMELPGRGKRFNEKLCLTMSEAIDDAYGRIQRDLDKGPYAFFGHSIGCLLVCELAHRIIKNGHNNPVHIFFSGHVPGDVEDKTCFSDERLNKFAQDYQLDKTALLSAVHHTVVDSKICFCKSDIEKVKSSHPEIHHALSIKCSLPPDLAEDEFIREAIDIKDANREIFDNEELKDLLLPSLRADIGICHSYRWLPKPSKLKSDITVLYGIGEEDIITPDIEHWENHTDGKCRIIPFRGEHFYFEENLKEIIAIINQTLSGYCPKE
jgi:medium-chain acyl-[acyl-carrier-protein] hydrolase